MLLALVLFLSSFAHAAPLPKVQPELFCQINQEGVESVEFHWGHEYPLTTVAISWAGGARTTIVLEQDFSQWAAKGFVLSMRSPGGRVLNLDVRAGKSGMFGFFEGSDGSPFPVSCVGNHALIVRGN